MATFNLPIGIKISNNSVLDASRYTVPDITSRDFIVTDGRAYAGMQTYVENDQKLYILKSLSPVTWDIVGSDTSTYANIDTSINDVYVYVNGSLVNFIKSSSIGNTLYWNGGIVNVSDYISKTQVDATLGNYLLNTRDTFHGELTIDGSLHILGNLIADGSNFVTTAETLLVADNFIVMRNGALSALEDGSLSGIKIMIPNGINNIIFGTGNDGIVRLGYEGGTLEALATREDAPVNGYLAYWDDSSTMLKFIPNFATNKVSRAGDTMSGTLNINNAGAISIDVSGDIKILNGNIWTHNGSGNTRLGIDALLNCTSTGHFNTAVGKRALYDNTVGDSNNAFGADALYYNTIGINNTGVGYFALGNNKAGSNNVGIGDIAGAYLPDYSPNASSNNSIFLGAWTKAASINDINEIVIGYETTGAGSNSVTLGNDDIITTLLKGKVGIGKTPIFSLDVSGNLHITGVAFIDGSLNILNKRILGVSIPIDSSDAVNKFYVDNNFTLKTVFDSSVNWLYANMLNTLALDPYATNASIGLAGFLKSVDLGLYATNASVGLALNNYTTFIYVDGSLHTHQDQINSLSYRISQLETSTGDVNKSYVDGSLYKRDLSINELYLIKADKTAVDSSFGQVNFDIAWLDAYKAELSDLYPYATNVSVGLAIAPYATNVSIGNAHFLKEASASVIYATNSSVNYTFSILQGGITTLNIQMAAVESSLNAFGGLYDASINNLYTYVDGSLALRDAQIDQLDASIIRIDGSLNNKLDNTTDTFTGMLTLNGSLYITGNIYQNGSTYIIHAQSLDVSNAFITLRAGAVTRIPDGSISGLRIVKANGTNDVLFGTGNDAILRIGWDLSTFQAIATREDHPTNGYWAYWDNSSTMIKFKDTSTSWVNAQIGQLNASIIRIDNSINDTIDAYSLFLPNASIGTGFAWSAGMLNVSTGAGVSSLSALTDVSISSIADKNLLQYSTTSSKWINVAPLDASAYFQKKIVYNSIPGTATSGTAGDLVYDSSYMYICISTNKWGRVLLDYAF